MIIKLFALQTWIRKLLTPCVKETFYFCPSLSGEMLFFLLVQELVVWILQNYQ